MMHPSCKDNKISKIKFKIVFSFIFIWGGVFFPGRLGSLILVVYGYVYRFVYVFGSNLYLDGSVFIRDKSCSNVINLVLYHVYGKLHTKLGGFFKYKIILVYSWVTQRFSYHVM